MDHLPKYILIQQHLQQNRKKKKSYVIQDHIIQVKHFPLLLLSNFLWHKQHASEQLLICWESAIAYHAYNHILQCTWIHMYFIYLFGCVHLLFVKYCI